MATPQAAVGYRLQLAATYLAIRVKVGVASLAVILTIAGFGSLENDLLAVAIVALDLAVNYVESRRTNPRAVVSLFSLATMLGLIGLIVRVPALMGSSLVFIIVIATVIASARQSVAIVAYSAAWTVVGLLVLQEFGMPGSGAVSSFVADAISIGVFASATVVFVTALTRRLDLFDRLRSRLISSASHELRTPLTGLHGLATVLQDNYDDLSPGEIAEFLDLLVLESAEATALVEDLLTAVRPTDHIRLESRMVDLADEIRAVVSTLGPVMAKPVKLIDGSGLTAYADPTRLRQIVRNLLTNAERYGGPHLEIRADATGTEVTITVSDDGPGIPPTERDAVFEEWQGSDIGSQHPQSVGLGLTISRRLARAMDGELTYSYVDGESRFTLTLPATADTTTATPV